MSSSLRFLATSLGAALLVACAGDRVPLPPMPPLTPVPASPPGPAAAGSVPRAAPGQASVPRMYLRPAQGPVIGRFDGRTNKGVDLGGTLGEPVVASREGRVALVSTALPEYGTMVVIKHDEAFITAYAHLSKVLVKEGDLVQQGQPIGEMGSTGTDRTKLHFEIRNQGTAVDPMPYLSGALP
jgi:lipoprotein NlpD